MVVRRYCIEIHGVCDPLCLQTQLTDAQQRVRDLEAEVARSKLELSMQSRNTPCPKCRSMEASYREVLSQVSVRESSFFKSKFPEGMRDYHNVRSSAFANLCAGSPSKVGCVFHVVLTCGFFPLCHLYLQLAFQLAKPSVHCAFGVELHGISYWHGQGSVCFT